MTWTKSESFWAIIQYYFVRYTICRKMFILFCGFICGFAGNYSASAVNCCLPDTYWPVTLNLASLRRNRWIFHEVLVSSIVLRRVRRGIRSVSKTNCMPQKVFTKLFTCPYPCQCLLFYICIAFHSITKGPRCIANGTAHPVILHQQRNYSNNILGSINCDDIWSVRITTYQHCW